LAERVDCVGIERSGNKLRTHRIDSKPSFCLVRFPHHHRPTISVIISLPRRMRLTLNSYKVFERAGLNRSRSAAQRPAPQPRLATTRATGITAYLKNGATLEKAAAMANHASTRTTQLYDRRAR